jgi:hypothetical protein
VYQLRRAILWLRLDDKMHVVLVDTQLTDAPLIDPTCFIQQLSQADHHFASQYAPTILRYPHRVVLQVVFRMGASSGIWPWPDHMEICSALLGSTLLRLERQPSPGLNAYGFLAWLIKFSLNFPILPIFWV